MKVVAYDAWVKNISRWQWAHLTKVYVENGHKNCACVRVCDYVCFRK